MITFVIGWLLLLWPSQSAERAYRNGRYEEAQQLFRAALEEPGAARGALNYNLGNCAFRLGAHADAVLHYYRAQHFLPGDDRVAFNLRLAERALGVARPPTSSPLDAVVDWLDGMAPLTLLTIVTLLQAAGGLLAAAHRPRLRVAAALVLALAWAGGARLVHNQWFATQHAIVLATTIELRREPHLAMAVSHRLLAGERFEIAEASDRWLRIVREGSSWWTQRAGVGWIE